MSAELLRELQHVKVVFQLRAIEAIIRGEQSLQPAQRVHRRKVHAVARDMRRDAGMPPSEALA